MKSNTGFALNAAAIDKDIEWFFEFAGHRISLYQNQENNLEELYTIEPPTFSEAEASLPYVSFVLQLTIEERIVLLLAFLPHIRPEALDFFLTRNDLGLIRTEFGGLSGSQHRGFIPTGETALFLLSANNMMKRIISEHIFSKEHFFDFNNILHLGEVKEGEPRLSGALTLSKEYLCLLTLGEPYQQEYSKDFPAKPISTQLDWEDLVLGSETFDAVQEIDIWLQHGEQLLGDPDVGRKIKKGYRSLFYGPSGTGKTLTACLLGKSSGMAVYRIDLSMVVSKYIGETEKNLAKVFDIAQNRNWILFFDEADSLFGKRTQTSSSNDRYANQEVSYLLQRIEDFPGVIILASNYKSNMDQAFMRRFQSIIRFPMPSENLRMTLYKKAFQGKYSLSDEINLNEVARKYELSGGNIINVLRYCAMMTINNKETIVTEDNFLEGIRKELKKIGKTL